MGYKKLVVVILAILGLSIVSYWYFYSVYGTNDFTIKNWYTISEDSSTMLVIEFETKIENGNISLYDPSDILIGNEKFIKNNKMISFLISETKSLSTKVGNYSIIISQNANDIVEKKIILEKAQITINTFSPIWNNFTNNYYSISKLNISFINSGDIFGYIWEGKIIFDNTSNWFSPNKHYHDLDIWVAPNDQIYVELPLDLTQINSGKHSIDILFTDKNQNEVTLFSTIISTPDRKIF